MPVGNGPEVLLSTRLTPFVAPCHAFPDLRLLLELMTNSKKNSYRSSFSSLGFLSHKVT